MFSLFRRAWAIFFAKGNAAISQAEEANIKELLEVRIQEANKSLAKAQAGVAAAFGQSVLMKANYEKLVEEEKQMLARFRALDQAGATEKANAAAGEVARIRTQLAEAKSRMEAAETAAKTSQRTLEAARKAQEKNIAEARRNANEIASNRALASALETAQGLVSETEGNAAEFQRLANMAKESNATQKGRILAAQGSLENSGLLDDAATEAVLNADAAASLRAELNLAPKKQATKSEATPETEARQM